jgi:hypothetical protein
LGERWGERLGERWSAKVVPAQVTRRLRANTALRSIRQERSRKAGEKTT